MEVPPFGGGGEGRSGLDGEGAPVWTMKVGIRRWKGEES